MICSQRFVMDNTLNSKYNQLLAGTKRAVFLKDMYWDNGTNLTIYFYPLPSNASSLKWLDVSNVPSSKLDPLYSTIQGKTDPINAVKAVIASLFEPLNLSYQFVNNPNQAVIRIAFDPAGGSWSYVGKQNTTIPTNQPTMSFGWLDVGCMFHELCHALGMVHEHQNPRDSPLQWNMSGLLCMMSETQSPPWTQSDIEIQIVDTYSLDTINSSVFDPNSIMLYFFPKSYFCKTTGQTVLLTKNGASTHPNFKLSETDWFWLKSIYPKQGQRTFPDTALSQEASSSTTYSPFVRYARNTAATIFIIFLIFMLYLAFYEEKRH